MLRSRRRKKYKNNNEKANDSQSYCFYYLCAPSDLVAEDDDDEENGREGRKKKLSAQHTETIAVTTLCAPSVARSWNGEKKNKKCNFISIYYNLLLFIGYFISTIKMSCGICKFYTTEMNCNKPVINCIVWWCLWHCNNRWYLECVRKIIYFGPVIQRRARARSFHRCDSSVQHNTFSYSSEDRFSLPFYPITPNHTKLPGTSIFLSFVVHIY